MACSAKAAVLKQYSEELHIQPIEVSEPRDDEVLVEINACGVCHTDLIILEGRLSTPLPVVLGHEGAGTVVSVGSLVTHVQPGDAVILSYSSCGSCRSCDHKEPAYCRDFMQLNFGVQRTDGSTGFSSNGRPLHSHFFGQSAFSTHVLTPVRNVVKAPLDISLETLAPLGCGIQTGAGAVLNELEVRPHSSILVMGAGALGLSAIMAAGICKAEKIVALDLSEDRLALAKELGATHIIKTDGRSVSDLTSRLGIDAYDYILDTTGVPDLVNQAASLLDVRGALGVCAAYPHEVDLQMELSSLMIGGRRVLGIVEGNSVPQTFIPELIDYYRDGKFPFDRLIEFFEFDDINLAFDACKSGKVIKPVIRISQ